MCRIHTPVVPVDSPEGAVRASENGLTGQQKRVLVVGCGTGSSGDDAVGFRVIRQLAASRRSSSSVRFVALGRVGIEILDTFEAEDELIFIDAVCSGRPAGTITISPMPVEGVTQRSSAGEDGWGVAEVLALARSTGRRVPRAALIGIEVPIARESASDAVTHAGAWVFENFDELRSLVTSRVRTVLEPRREHAHA